MLSDKPGALALSRARASGIETSVVEFGNYPDRESFSNAVVDEVERVGAELVILAGFMRILSPSAVERLRGRMINLHPSLLPDFPGVDSIGQALDKGVEVTGVTVHFVDEGVDTGPVIAQVEVPVLPDDDRESLHSRIQLVEHRLLPAVVLDILAGKVEVGA